jgi:hypothetical protein
MGEYIPRAPIDDEAKKYNQNLPGMGGVFNYINLHAYHYAGNNPVKLRDPTGQILELAPGTGSQEEALYNKAIEYIKSSKDGARLIEKLDQSETVYTIRVVSEVDDYNSEKKEIRWNPYSALDIDGKLQSSAMGLAHELGHALQDDLGMYEGRSQQDLEDEILQFIELPIGVGLNEPLRKNYSDVNQNDQRTVMDPTKHTHVEYEIK